MTQLPLDQAIPRFKGNEERVDQFVNGSDTATWQSSDGAVNPSIRKFLKSIDDEATEILDDAVASFFSAFEPLLNTVADGVTDTYTLAQPVASVNGHLNVNVQVGGVPQPKDGASYTIIDAGTKIKFSEIPAAPAALYVEGAAVFSGTVNIDISSGTYLFPTKATVEAATIPVAITAIQVAGLVSASDNLGGIYTTVNNGAADTIISADGRTWYKVPNLFAYIRRTLKEFGAVGDGIADDTAAVVAALAAGVPLTGTKKTYAVSGNISIPANLDLEDAKFKQLSPNNASRRTLYANGVNSVALRRVTVDRNGNGLGGGLSTAAGIYIQGGSGHNIEDCEVFGADMGSGFVFDGCTDFVVTRPHAHDITYTSATLPLDDQVQGIWFSGCERFTVVAPRTKHIGGIVGGSFRRAFGRMMPLGFGCKDFAIIGGNLSDGDVGIDLTGSKGNQRFSIFGVTVEDVETWGIKVANYNRFGQIIGCNVHRAGSAGFVGSGPTVNSDPDSPTPESLPIHVTFEACGAWDTGFGNTGRGTSQPAGFLVTPGGASNFQDYPRGYRMINCVAYDNQAVKTQYDGFRNEVIYGGAPLNEAINCRAGGFVSGGRPIKEFHAPVCAVSRSTAQSIPNASDVEIDFDVERIDKAAMHSTSSNVNRIFVPRTGFYRVTGKVTFVTNGTGMRQANLTVGGVVITGAQSIMPGSTVNDITLNVDTVIEVTDITGGIGLRVYQNSGGALNVSANATLTVVEAAMYG